MPPAQCPDCGRFLKKDLIESLADSPQPCPKCERELTAADFGIATGASAPSGAVPVASTPEPVASWDQSGSVSDDFVTSEPPPEAAIMAGASAAGALIGALVCKKRLRGFLIGGALGAAAAGAAQQIWELPE